MRIIFCDDYECVHNRSSVCGKDDISIKMKFGEYEAGERVCYHDCRDYRGSGDAD